MEPYVQLSADFYTFQLDNINALNQMRPLIHVNRVPNETGT